MNLFKNNSFLMVIILILSGLTLASETADSPKSVNLLPPTQKYFMTIKKYLSKKMEAQRKVSSEEQLKLDNVFMGHADPRTFEPGDKEYYFPVAAKIFYGFRPMEDYKIDVSENCKKWISVAVKTGPNGEKKYTLSCKPSGDASKVFNFTTDSQSFSQEEDSADIVLGTSFTFIPSVKLSKTGPKTYLLNIQSQ